MTPTARSAPPASAVRSARRTRRIRSLRRCCAGRRTTGPPPAWSTPVRARGATCSPRGEGSPRRSCTAPTSIRWPPSCCAPTWRRRGWPAGPASTSATTAHWRFPRRRARRSSSATRRTCATTRSRRSGRPGSCRPPADTACTRAPWRACTSISSSPPPSTGAAAISARSSPPRSGWTSTTAHSCAGFCSTSWAASRSTSSRPRRSRSRMRRRRGRSPASA